MNTIKNHITTHANTPCAELPGRERVAGRSASSRDFDLGRGRHQAIVYAGDVHFKGEDGWREIDCRLTERDDAFVSDAGPMRVTLPKHSDQYMTIEADGRTLKWRVLHGAAAACDVLPIAQARRGAALDERCGLSAREASARYAAIAPGVDCELRITGAGVKQDIVLANAEAASRAALEICLPGAHAQVDDAGRVELVDDAGGRALFTFEPAYTYDAQGRESIARASVQPVADGRSVLRYALDDEFLREATFPVTIDPLIRTSQTAQSGEGLVGNYVSSKSPSSVYSAARSLHICANSSSGTRYAFVKCPQLPGLATGCTVTRAYLNMALYDAAASTHYLGLREVTGAWDAASLSYNNMPVVSDAVLDYVTASSSDSKGKKYSFDITNLVRRWYADPTANHGVRIESMSSASGYVELCSPSYSTSSYRPQLVIEYVTGAGLGASTQYDAHACGRAGEASVNLFNGNLTVQRALTATNGGALPVSVAAYYNACLADECSTLAPMGRGWSLSCAEWVTQETIGSDTYYVQHLGDGTQRWFEQGGSSSTFNDMEGLALTLKVTSSAITIADKQDNVSTYQPCAQGGRLLKMTSALNISVQFTYTGGVLTAITDGSGRETALGYEGGRLTSVSAPGYAAGGDVTLAYDGDRLTGITDRDGGQATYEYAEQAGLCQLTRMAHGTRAASLMYDANIPWRVTGVKHIGGGSVGSACAYDYGNCLTRVTDKSVANGKALSYYFNDQGNVTSVQDELGQAQFANFPANNLPNHPSEVSALRRTVVNLLPNHGFEDAADVSWAFSLEDGSAGTQTYSTAQKRLGTRSVQITRATTAGRQSWYTSLMLEGGRYHTVSVYAKGASGMHCRIRANDNQGNYTWGEAVALNDSWQRASVTFKTVDTLPHWISILIEGGTGTAWLDCAQLEEDIVPNQYNLLENGRFARALDGWTPYDENTAEDGVIFMEESAIYEEGVTIPPAKLPDSFLNLVGHPTKTAGVYQEIAVSGSKGDVYVVGGWAQGRSKPIKGEERRFCMRLSFWVSGSWVNAGDIKWNEEWSDWQYASGVCIAPGSYTKLRFDVSYQRNVNDASFTNFALYKEEFGASYGYDSYGNILSASDLTGSKSHATYDGQHNLTSYRQPGRSTSEKYALSWGTTDAERRKHLLNNVQSPEGVVDAYLYDDFGNVTLSRVRDAGRSVMMQSTATYDASGNYKTTDTDSRGNSTAYAHDANTGALTSATLPNGQRVDYAYDAMQRLTAVQAQSGAYRNEYAYDAGDDHLAAVRHNTTSAAADVEYHFAVNDLGQPTTTSVGTQALTTSVYEPDGKRRLLRTEYGNGGKVHLSYDAYDRVIGQRYDDEAEGYARYAYDYGATGKLARLTDNELGIVHTVERDLADRVSRLRALDEFGAGHEREITYDAHNHISGVTERIGSLTGGFYSEYAFSYAYDADDRPTSVRFGADNVKVTHAYDALGRAASRAVFNGGSAAALSTTYTYLAGAPIAGVNAASTTPLVRALTQNQRSFAYAYDDKTSNLISVRHIQGASATASDKYTYYVYDKLGQLIRVNDQTDPSAGDSGTTWVYEYDFGGNITARKRYAYQTGDVLTGEPVTTLYAYADANWKDKATSIGGQALTYDAIGNLVSDGEWTYSWQAGRQLKGMSKAGMSVVYRYDHNGMRVGKTVNGVETRYTLNGSTLTHMASGGDALHFFYDGNGMPALVEYNGARYAYLQNLQGDVIGLLDSTGALVVEYSYDAWGKPKGVTGSLAGTLGKVNPLRYRGYVWDAESGLYYLQSRYYNPTWGRFISADSVLGKAGALLAHNVFAYCRNKPTAYQDENGKAGSLAIGAGFALNGIISFAQAHPVITGGVLGGLLGAAVSTIQQDIQEKINQISRWISLSRAKEIPANAITAQTKVSALPRWKERSEQPRYWAVAIDPVSQYLIVMEPLTFTDAQVRVATELNVLAIDEAAARTLGGVFKHATPIGSERHNKNDVLTLPHYHITRVKPGYHHAHIFFLFPYMLE